MCIGFHLLVSLKVTVSACLKIRIDEDGDWKKVDRNVTGIVLSLGFRDFIVLACAVCTGVKFIQDDIGFRCFVRDCDSVKKLPSVSRTSLHLYV